jgi:uncharacterized membrane protein
MARQIVLGLAVIVIGNVLGANVYTSWVDARNWGANIPSSLMTAREYFAVVNPGSFFRAVSPIAQLLALLALIVCWKVPGARIAAAIALALTVAGDVMTFAYFYPRNDIMFVNAMNAEAAAEAWRGWSAMNHVRSALILGALTAELVALTRAAQLVSGAQR